MRKFPIQYRPEFDGPFIPHAFEYHNIIDKQMADEIIEMATSHDGWHRRGSKSRHVQASFTTTLLHDTSHPIYDILDDLWKKVTDEYSISIDFVEVYEVKEYVVGDRFGVHIDTHEKIDLPIDRKLNLILQLSDPETYEGGDLTIKDHTASRELGSAIFFPAGYQHALSTVTSGKRYSLIGHGWGSVNRR